MIEINIPGKYGLVQIEHVVLDFNGTLAIDGKLIDGVKKLLIELSEKFSIHVITADTFGQAKEGLDGIPCNLIILDEYMQSEKKAEYLNKLGSKMKVSIGNGRNDSLMLREAKISIAVIQKEGAFSGSVLNSDIICTNIIDALELLLNPLRLIATLRD